MTLSNPSGDGAPSEDHGACINNLEQPASTNQLSNTLKQIALVANILTVVYRHAPRHGAAPDVAHLASGPDGRGHATNEVREFRSHINAAFDKGITGTSTGARLGILERMSSNAVR